MLQFLKNRRKVTGTQLLLILFVFAITGFTTAYISKAITGWVGFTGATHWGLKLILRLVILIFGYQVILLLVAALLGQFRFFWQYEKKILTRFGIIKKQKITIQKTKAKETV